MTKAARTFGSWTLRERVMRGTPTADGMLGAARHLEGRREPRKILLVVTDGRAENVAAVAQVARHLEERGMEARVLEIGRHQRPFTPMAGAAVAGDVAAVPAALKSMLARALGGGA